MDGSAGGLYCPYRCYGNAEAAGNRGGPRVPAALIQILKRDKHSVFLHWTMEGGSVLSSSILCVAIPGT